MNACALFLPLIFFFEGEELVGAMDSQFVNSVFWGAMVIAGFFGFSIGIVTVLQIKATSPLSHNISGTAKAAVQSLMAFYLWGVSPFIHPFFYFSKLSVSIRLTYVLSFLLFLTLFHFRAERAHSPWCVGNLHCIRRIANIHFCKDERK